MNGCPDLAPLHGRLAGAMVTRDQQQDAISAVDRLIETAIDRLPGVVESHSVEVQCAIGFDITRSEAPVPASVERHAVVRLPWRCRFCPCRYRCFPNGLGNSALRLLRSDLRRDFLAGEG